jgi:hypothetical protein
MKKITFKIPDGYAPPEGLKEGAEFDAAATFKMEPGGKLCLVKVDDVPLKGYEDEHEEGRRANEGIADEGAGLAQRYAAAQQAMMADPQGGMV